MVLGSSHHISLLRRHDRITDVRKWQRHETNRSSSVMQFKINLTGIVKFRVCDKYVSVNSDRFNQVTSEVIVASAIFYNYTTSS